jgi:hypothetical protein
MTHFGDALNLHEAVLQRAKELCAGFCDVRELVAFPCEAFEPFFRMMDIEQARAKKNAIFICWRGYG